ncbi:MAG: hypothetical protein AB7O43_08740 [Hyphomicrobiaceae bacterium]
MATKTPPPVQSPGIQPQARPVDQFARPQAPAQIPDAPRTNGLTELANALGNFAPSLQRFGVAYAEAQQKGQDAAAADFALRTHVEELNRHIEKGTVPPGVNLALLGVKNGENLAKDHFEKDILRRYYGESTSGNPAVNNAFDRDKGDIQKWFAEAYAEHRKTISQDPATLEGYTRTMGAYRTQLYQMQNGYRSGRIKEANLDAAWKDQYGVLENLILSGEHDPGKLHKALREVEKKTGALHLLTPQEKNIATLKLAQHIATTGIPGRPSLGPELVRELLLSDRGGVGAIGMTAAHASDARKIMDAAKAKAEELQAKLSQEDRVTFRTAAAKGQLPPDFDEYVKENPHVFDAKEVEALKVQSNKARIVLEEKRRKELHKMALEAKAQASEMRVSQALREAGDAGRLHALGAGGMEYLKKDGSTGKYTRAELETRAVGEYLKMSDAYTRREIEMGMDTGAEFDGPSPTTPEERKMRRDIGWFAKNPGLKNPAWQTTLNAGYAAANPAALASNDPPTILTEALRLYEDLEAGNVGVLDSHLNGKDAKDFYNVYRVARTYLQQDERQALQTAALATKSAVDPEVERPQLKRLQEELGSVNSMWSNAPDVTNWGDALPDLRRTAMLLARAGMPMEDAVTEASKRVLKAYENVNGYLVRTNDRAIKEFGAYLRGRGYEPRTFGDIAKAYVDEYEKGLDPDYLDGARLSVKRSGDGDGVFTIVDAVSGFPVPSIKGRNPMFSASKLAEWEMKRQDAARGEIAKKQAEASEVRGHQEARRKTQKDALRRLFVGQPKEGAPSAPATAAESTDGDE